MPKITFNNREHLFFQSVKNSVEAYFQSNRLNFAPRNKVIGWLVGGLIQIEHHLFPQISHVHYPALNKIIRKQCELFGLPYNYYPTLRQAIYSHGRLMKELGRNNEIYENS